MFLFVLGKIDCFAGEDEKNCEILEQNECDPITEYRCRNGLCIPISFAFDDESDCSDGTDEFGKYNKWSEFYNTEIDDCTFEPSIFCGERVCGNSYFSCGDGQCIELANIFTDLCMNRRNIRYLYDQLAGVSTVYGKYTL